MKTFVLSDAPDVPSTLVAQDTHASETAAKLFLRVYKFDTKRESIEEAIWHIPPGDALAVMIGAIPKPDYYRRLYDALLEKGVRLVNTPEESLRSQQLDQSYPHLQKTPLTRWADSLDGALAAAGEIGYPVFVKGRSRSKKAAGWKSCVAAFESELRPLAEMFLSKGDMAVVREYVALRHTRTSKDGFPLGREFRVFLFHERIVGLGYYWDGPDPMAALSDTERATVEAFAVAVARSIQVPFLHVDVGQKEDGEWIVIEAGDGQFAGLSQVPPLPLWSNLAEALAADPRVSTPMITI